MQEAARKKRESEDKKEKERLESLRKQKEKDAEKEKKRLAEIEKLEKSEKKKNKAASEEQSKLVRTPHSSRRFPSYQHLSFPPHLHLRFPLCYLHPFYAKPPLTQQFPLSHIQEQLKQQQTEFENKLQDQEKQREEQDRERQKEEIESRKHKDEVTATLSPISLPSIHLSLPVDVHSIFSPPSPLFLHLDSFHSLTFIQEEKRLKDKLEEMRRKEKEETATSSASVDRMKSTKRFMPGGSSSLAPLEAIQESGDMGEAPSSPVKPIRRPGMTNRRRVSTLGAIDPSYPLLGRRTSST